MVPADNACKLLALHGPSGAWHVAPAAAVGARLGRELDRRDHWRAVQSELSMMAPRPGPGDRDIYRTANLLVQAKGAREAAACALQRAVELEGDVEGQAAWARVFEAIAVLARTEPGPEELTQ